MKILYITKFFPPEYGGIETLSKNICDHFYYKAKKIDVIAFSKKKTKVSYKNNYRVIFFKSLINLFSTPISFSIIFFLYKNYKKYDYLHLHTPNPWITFWISFIKIDNLVVSWGSDIVNQKILRFIFYPFQYIMLKNAKKIICLSKNYFNYSKELQKFKKKVIIIPPLINKKLSQKKYRRKKYINLISVGRIVDYKGYDIALKAISNLPENFKLRIIGSGDRELEINKLILELGIKNRVTVYKNVTDKIKTKMTLKSDIFLACSKSRAESFGIAILEAISLGMPLIISKVNGSGMNDMIINKYNGYFFRNNSATDCSKKIIKISNNINKLRLFSLNSKKIFNTKFNEKKTRQKLDKIYK